MLTEIDLFFNEYKAPVVAQALLGIKTESIRRTLLDVLVCGWPSEDISEVIQLRRKYLSYLWTAQEELLKYIVRVNGCPKQFAFHPVTHIRPWKFSLSNFAASNGEHVYNDLQASLKTLKQKTHLDKFVRGEPFKVKVILVDATKPPFSNPTPKSPRSLRRALESKEFKLVIFMGIKTFHLYNVADNLPFQTPNNPMTFALTCNTELSLCQLLMVYSLLSDRKKPRRVQMNIPCYSAFQIDYSSMKMFNELDVFPGWNEK